MSQPQIEELIVQPQHSNNLPTDDQVEEHQYKLIHHLETLKDTHHQDDITWFQRLISNSKENIESEDIDLGILYNLTYLDAITAKLLNIDPRKIIKAAIVKRYIRELWEDNNQPENMLESYILSDINSRSLIETVLRPSDSTEAAPQDIPVAVEVNIPVQEPSTTIEQEIPEVEMTQEISQEQELDRNKDNKEENFSSILGQDINTTSCYKTRNRTHQSINPFYVTEKGRYSAGTLIANTPGDTQVEQIKYLASILKLDPSSTNLIKTIFHNGNGWYTFNFELALDLEECINKINGKKQENFQIITLQNPDLKEINSNPETPSTSKKGLTKNNNNLKGTQQGVTYQETPKASRTNQQTNKSENLKKSTWGKKRKPNQFNIVENSSYYQLRVRCATIPGSNREQQLQNLTDILQIPLESDLIQVSCIGRSKLAVLNFENPEDLRTCRKELLDQLPSCETFISGKDSEQHSEQKMYSTGESSQTSIRVTDIPNEFSTSRIRGAIQKYGKIQRITIIKGNNNFKSAIVTLDETKLDLEETWAIPMGEVMARITPAEDWENTLVRRNIITSRLYGISNSTSATRIMSAIKHLKAKTVYIPKNSKTNKRRRFAIIGFSSQEDLQQALSAHVELFGLQTWWSTKDNQKINNKGKNGCNTCFTNTNSEGEEEEDNMSTISIHSSSSDMYSSTLRKEAINTRVKQSSKKQSGRSNKNSRRKQPQSTTPEVSLTSITSVLQDIAKRLGKLEEKGKRSRIPNRS
jgi:hypothetical protein